MSQNYRIGCSGYYYPYWKNRFYPRGVQPKNWLQYYSSVFNTVEMNGTFYRQPKPADLKRYKEVTPDDFRFSVKMSRYITHTLKLKNAGETIRAFQHLIWSGLGEKLSCFLFQMPASFQYSEENLERILTMIPPISHNVIELRHASWWTGEVKQAFTEAKLTFCNVDFPGLASFNIQTSPVFYLRMHGNPELFKSSYSDEELRKVYGEFPADSREYFVYFNNTMFEAGYRNAAALKEIVPQA